MLEALADFNEIKNFTEGIDPNRENQAIREAKRNLVAKHIEGKK
jgi:hypothetical protein